MSFHHQQAVPSHHSDVVASFRNHSIGSKSFKHSAVIFIALKLYRRSIVSPSFQCPPTPASSFHRPEVEFVVASSGSHSGVSLSSHVIPFVRRSTVREAFPRHPRFLILGSSEEEHLSRPRPDRFGPFRSVHSAFRTLFPATPTSGPSSRPTRDRSPTTPFRTVSRNRRGGRVPPVSSSGVIQEPSHHSEAFHHFGVVPSFRSHSDAVPSFRCHFTDKKSPIVSKSFSHSKVDFVQPIRRPVDGPSSQRRAFHRSTIRKSNRRHPSNLVSFHHQDIHSNVIPAFQCHDAAPSSGAIPPSFRSHVDVIPSHPCRRVFVPTLRSHSCFSNVSRASLGHSRLFPGHPRPFPDHSRPVSVHFITIQRQFQVVSCSFHDRLPTIQDRFPAISGRFLTISGHFLTISGHFLTI